MAERAAVQQDAATLRRRSLPTPSGEPSTRSLLMTVLGEYVLGMAEPVWSAALIRSLEVLGVQEKTARQAITRSGADGWMDREQVGRQVRWTLTPATRRLLVEGAARIYGFAAATDGWDGRWLLVRLAIPEDQRDHRHHLRSRLAWAGFGSLGQGLWISPHADRRAELLETLATPDGPELPMTFTTEPRSLAEDRDLVAEAWGDRAELQAAYAAFVAEFEDLPIEVAGPPADEQAFVAQTRMVHEWRKFPFMDPGLPRGLLADDWIGLRAADVFTRQHARLQAPAAAWFARAAT